VRACFRRSQDEAAGKQETGLRVKLRLQETPELADLPWEFLYDSTRKRFLAQSVQTPIVRYIEMPERVPPLIIQLPLRVLVAIASPTDDPRRYPLLDVAREKSMLSAALEPLDKSGQVQVQWLETGDAACLTTLFARGNLSRVSFHRPRRI